MTYYLTEGYTEDEEGEIVTTTKLRLIDDTELPGDSLALRRLQIKALDVPLFPLRKALFFLGDLIKVAVPSQWLIDSNGKVFNYAKQRRVPLRSYPITGVFDIGGGGAIIEIDYAQRFKVLHKPKHTMKYAGVLTLGLEKILYGLYEEPFDETWRLI
jgi:hypothetical protein